MENWDDEKLKQVVNAKKGGQGERVKTDIICKHFLEAVEKRQYGWFWECPNGGDKCQYRHALPDGYVLKRDRVDEVIDEGPTLRIRLRSSASSSRRARPSRLSGCRSGSRRRRRNSRRRRTPCSRRRGSSMQRARRRA